MIIENAAAQYYIMN